MANSAYGTPLIIAPGGSPAKMARVSLSANVHAAHNRAEMKEYLAQHINLLTNTFRPRLKRLAETGT